MPMPSIAYCNGCHRNVYFMHNLTYNHEQDAYLCGTCEELQHAYYC